jgi:hypothetical protein
MDSSANGEVIGLAELVSSHQAYSGTDWTYIALVATITRQRRSMFGYVFFSDGHWEAKLPRDPQRSVMKGFRRLHDRMAALDGVAWQQCLLEITRQDQTVSVEFEYDDPDRWSLTPDNLEQILDGAASEA